MVHSNWIIQGFMKKMGRITEINKGQSTALGQKNDKQLLPLGLMLQRERLITRSWRVQLQGRAAQLEPWPLLKETQLLPTPGPARKESGCRVKNSSRFPWDLALKVPYPKNPVCFGQTRIVGHSTVLLLLWAKSNCKPEDTESQVLQSKNQYQPLGAQSNMNSRSRRAKGEYPITVHPF